MSELTQQFLADQRLLREVDLAHLMGWNVATTKAKISRGLVPRFIRQKRVVLFPFDDVREWLENGDAQSSDSEKLAALDILKSKRCK